MKTNKNVIGLFFLICLNFISVTGIGQIEKTDIEKLKSYPWKYKGLKDCKDIYSNNTIKHFAGKYMGVDKFYLSESIDSIFIEKKMGAKSNGKYMHVIAMRNKNYKGSLPLSIFEIIELNDERMKLKIIETGIIVEFYPEK